MGSNGGTVGQLVDELGDVLARLAGTDVVGLADDEVHGVVPRLLAAVNQVGAITAGLVGSFDVRGLSELDACRTTRTWLIAFGRLSQGAAGGWLVQARLLRQFPALAARAGAGSVSAEQVRLVVALADRVGVEKVVPFDAILADLAASAGPGELARACDRLLAHLDPDGAQPDPAEAFERRELTLSRSGAMTYLRGRLDPEGAAAVQTALDALMRPAGPDDLRTPAQRRADAAVDLARLALTQGAVPTIGGVRPHIGVLITPTMLYQGLGTDRPSLDRPSLDRPSLDGPGIAAAGAGGTGPPGGGDTVSPCCRPDPDDPLTTAGVPPRPDLPWMNWINEIPTALAQRLACDAELWRAVMDPATGLPLEVGRAHRVVPHWIRKALHARDRGCRWPGCQVPTAWTDAHHLLAWWLGGLTDIDNLLLLCRYHHSKVHEGQWTLTLDRANGHVHIHRPDGTPYQVGTSPPFVSPTRQSRAA